MDLMTRLSNDLSLLNASSVDEIELELRNVLSTGDEVVLSNGSSVFVQQLDTIEVIPNKSVLTPFENSLSGGNITVTTAEEIHPT